jgi:lipoate-protein ligase A
MLVVKNEHTDLAFNLAAEEYMVNNFEEEVFMLWRAESSILLGKNQNAYSEMNMPFVEANNIKVIRRMSGGGAVYCDLGNTNFCFIMNDSGKHFTDFERFTRPIIAVLKDMGVDAKFTGRNDMTIDGRKFSGNAQYKIRNRMLHHGTLLFKSDIYDLSQSLNPSPVKFSDKAVKSVKSRVTNIWEHLEDKTMDVMDFRERISKYIMSHYPEAQPYEFNEKELEKINELMFNKYDTWEWNYGFSPKFNYKKAKKFSGGVVEVYAEIHKGTIRDISFHGDFFGDGNLDEFNRMLIGQSYQIDEIRQLIQNVDIDYYFKNIDLNQILEVIFQ